MIETSATSLANPNRKLSTIGDDGNHRDRDLRALPEVGPLPLIHAPVEAETKGEKWDRWERFETTASIDLKAVTNPERHERRFVAPQFQVVNAQIFGMEKWEGHVVDVDTALFTAELWPLGDNVRDAVVLADFNVADISESDRELLAVGATFYCNVRSILGPGGQPHRTSSLRMRRLGLWTAATLTSAAERGRREAREFAAFVE